MMASAHIVATTKPRVPARVYARPFDEELVLLDFSAGEYFGLDAIGAEVWRAIDGRADLESIAGVIASRYEVTRDVALRDVIALVTEMRDSGLVEVD